MEQKECASCGTLCNATDEYCFECGSIVFVEDEFEDLIEETEE